jgi:threonine efflux protein
MNIDTFAIASASVVCLAGVMSPGPNFVAVTHRAVSSSRLEAFALVLGIMSVNALWAGAALFGLTAVFKLFPWVFWAVKIFGAGYLIWFGIQLLRKSGNPLPEKPTQKISNTQFFKAFRQGLITNLSNPKSMVFYASIFSSAVPAQASNATLVGMVLMVAVLALLWYGTVALVLSGDRVECAYRKVKPYVERSCGCLLVFFGLRQALVKS